MEVSLPVSSAVPGEVPDWLEIVKSGSTPITSQDVPVNCANAFDWTDNERDDCNFLFDRDDSSFELPSIDSSLMIDTSHEVLILLLVCIT